MKKNVSVKNVINTRWYRFLKILAIFWIIVWFGVGFNCLNKLQSGHLFEKWKVLIICKNGKRIDLTDSSTSYLYVSDRDIKERVKFCDISSESINENANINSENSKKESYSIIFTKLLSFEMKQTGPVVKTFFYCILSGGIVPIFLIRVFLLYIITGKIVFF